MLVVGGGPAGLEAGLIAARQGFDVTIAERAELKEAREAARDASKDESGREAALEAELEAEREKRVEHLAQVGVRRIMQKALALGWQAWLDQWLFGKRQRQMLARAARR